MRQPTWLLILCTLIMVQSVAVWMPPVVAAVSISYNAGSDTITVTGGTLGSEVTPYDVWLADRDNDWNQTCQTCENATKGLGQQNIQYFFDCKLQIGDGSTTTWFATEGEQLIFTKGVYRTLFVFGGYGASPNAHFRMGNYDANGLAFNGTAMSFYNSAASQVLFESYNGNVSMLDSYIFLEHGGLAWYYGLNVNGGIVDIDRSRIDGDNNGANCKVELRVKDCQVTNLEIYGLTFIPKATPNYEWTDITLLGDPYLDVVLHPHFGNPIVVRGLEVDTAQTYTFQIYGSGGSDANCTLINPTVDWSKITFEAPQNSEEWWIQFTLDLTVTYQNTTAINGTATGCRVVLRHHGVNSGVDYNATLGADGTIPQQTMTYRYYNATGGATPYDYNPYQLSITNVTGYQDYVGNFTLNTSFDQRLSLMESTVASNVIPVWGFALGGGFLAVVVVALFWVMRGRY